MFLDVIFISYDELNADENWQDLLEKVPYAKRVHGIKGIANAHIEASNLVSTSHFFCIDGDNIVNDNFNFEKVIDFQRQDKRIHAWGCKNAVNSLEYGYGGVKLFPTDLVKNSTKHSIDFCTSVAAANNGFRFHKEMASTTHFNTSPFNAWKSGFRECTKLASGIIDNNIEDESFNRLTVWMGVGLDSEYGDYAILGARMGTELGLFNTWNDEFIPELSFGANLDDINNFDKCEQIFNEYVKDKNTENLIHQYGKKLSLYFKYQPCLYPPELSRHFRSVVYEL